MRIDYRTDSTNSRTI